MSVNKLHFGEMECCGYTWHSAGKSKAAVIKNLYKEWKKEVGVGTNGIKTMKRFEEWYGIRVYTVSDYIGKVEWD